MAQPTTLVLVVDDDPAILAFIRATLELEGYLVRTATNGFEALRCIEVGLPRLPDVVLLDLQMPVMDGWQCAQTLRARWGRAVPIIAMSATADASAWTRQINADGLLSKPFELAALIAIVERRASPDAADRADDPDA